MNLSIFVKTQLKSPQHLLTCHLQHYLNGFPQSHGEDVRCIRSIIMTSLICFALFACVCVGGSTRVPLCTWRSESSLRAFSSSTMLGKCPKLSGFSSHWSYFGMDIKIHLIKLSQLPCGRARSILNLNRAPWFLLLWLQVFIGTGERNMIRGVTYSKLYFKICMKIPNTVLALLLLSLRNIMINSKSQCVLEEIKMPIHSHFLVKACTLLVPSIYPQSLVKACTLLVPSIYPQSLVKACTVLVLSIQPRSLVKACTILVLICLGDRMSQAFSFGPPTTYQITTQRLNISYEHSTLSYTHFLLTLIT